jgi:SOS-response transcriptional repressor LexA
MPSHTDPATTGGNTPAVSTIQQISLHRLDTYCTKRPPVPITPGPGTSVEVDAAWIDRTGTEYLRLVTGDCMAPDIRDGDLIAIKRQDTAEDGDIVEISSPGGIMVKAYMRIDGREYIFPADVKYPMLPMGDVMTIVGVVVGVIRFTD